MCRKIPAIVLLLVFFSLQFGKITVYIYCNWQAQLQQQSCDCNKHLVAHFQDEGNHHDFQGSASLTIKEKLTEVWEITDLYNISLVDINTEICFDGYTNETTLQGFPSCSFRPPSA